MAVTGGRAVAYRRVSTQDQADSGLGLDAQQTLIAATAQRLSVTVDMTFTDAGLSGSLGLEHRPGLADALNALHRGDVLLVAKRDRIARDAFLAVLVEREVARKGARIISAAGEGTETDDPAAVFTRRILDAVSELERALIASRTRAAMAEARKRGQRVGRIPFGMALGDDGRMLMPNPEERAMLAEIHRLRNRGYALISIAHELNARGWRNRQNRPWQANFIGQLLSRHPMVDCASDP
jgi:DNA invertase Pin-like site-specific DNA recombinase